MCSFLASPHDCPAGPSPGCFGLNFYSYFMSHQILGVFPRLVLTKVEPQDCISWHQGMAFQCPWAFVLLVLLQTRPALIASWGRPLAFTQNMGWWDHERAANSIKEDTGRWDMR